MTSINLNFDGYYPNNPTQPDSNIEGIYIVYAGKSTKPEKCQLNRLIYIGESSTTIAERLSNHERKNDWISELKHGEQLYFAITEVKGINRRNAEAALIYKHQPKCNTEFMDNYPYTRVTINSKMKNGKDVSHITPSFSI